MNTYLSLVVLSYNNWEYTEQCLTTLLTSVDQEYVELGTEIIVVDNGSDEYTRRALREFADKKHGHHQVRIQLLELASNLGYTSGMNAGLGVARGQVIGVLNNDLVFPQGWLKPLVDAVRNDRLVGLAAPYMSYAASTQGLQKSFSSYEEMVQFAAGFTEENRDRIDYPDKVVGACVILRRDFLTTVGGNDFWFGIGNYDDDDWCLRAQIAGYKIALVGRSFVHHAGHATFRTHTEEYQSSLTHNALKFERKWDVSERVHPTGSYSRLGASRYVRYERGLHYVPVALSDYSLDESPFFPRQLPTQRVLLCADWTSETSQWRRALAMALTSLSNVELCLWIPGSYYDVNWVVNEVQAIMLQTETSGASDPIQFKIFGDAPFVETLRVLRSVDQVIRIPTDFVNRYIAFMSGQLQIPELVF